jgi:hypothetical protein
MDDSILREIMGDEGGPDSELAGQGPVGHEMSLRASGEMEVSQLDGTPPVLELTENESSVTENGDKN